MADIQIVTLEDARQAFREEAAKLSESLRKKQGPSSRSETSYLSSSDVQKELGVSKATLARWRHDNKIRFSRIGGKLLYLRSDIDRLVQSHIVIGVG